MFRQETFHLILPNMSGLLSWKLIICYKSLKYRDAYYIHCDENVTPPSTLVYWKVDPPPPPWCTGMWVPLPHKHFKYNILVDM